MAANNTPIYDLIEISTIAENRTYTTDGSGGGFMFDVVDNARYSDGDPSNSSTQIAELNESGSANGGKFHIDGVNYNFTLVEPEGNVTVLRGDGTGGTTQQVVFIRMTPEGGGAARNFVLFDDNLGNIGNIESIRTSTLDFTPAGDDTNINADQNNNIQAVCFSAGTLIATPEGPRTVESVQVFDRVMTMDHGSQPVIWTGGLEFDARQLTERPDQRPIRIEANTFGFGLPNRALEVSPQHRILLRSSVAKRMFGSSEILVPAVKLLGMPGVSRSEVRAVHYVHLLLRNHEILFAEGLPSESLFLGPQTREILADQPSFASATSGGPDAPAARTFVQRGGDVDELLRRIAKNEKDVLEQAT